MYQNWKLLVIFDHRNDNNDPPTPYVMSFRVGQRIVCVDAYSNLLIRGRVYTVRSVDACCKQWVDVGVPVEPGGSEVCFDCGAPSSFPDNYVLFEATAFRPVIDITTELADIARRSITEERPEHINAPQVA